MGLKLSEKRTVYCVERITDAIRKKTDDASARGVVVSLSGGLDSALVLHLACRATDVVALMLPESEVPNPGDLDDATKLAKSYGVKHEIVGLDDVLNAINRKFPWETLSSDNKRLSWGNVKARARMVFSYLAANLDNRIVLGTSNKTELLLGYFTKYGDGASDLLPIGDLYKTQIRQIAEHVGLPKSIIEKTPSAGLWIGQTDEGELGLSYESIDRILYCLTERKLDAKKTAKEVHISLDDVRALEKRMLRNRHKTGVPETVKLT